MKTSFLARTGFALLLSLVALAVTPVSASAGVFVSVNIAPPPLLVYEQPVAPYPDYLWQPGYWAWDGYEYYWVPGTWVEPPEPGLLWTPGYWGWDAGFYLWHTGYWGPHVGFYGGVNYGWGYPGYGFYGGFWEGGHFCYNTAYSHVTVVNVYKTYNRTVVVNNEHNHVSYNGGEGGIHRHPKPDEERAERERHFEPTHDQYDHERTARDNPGQHFGHDRQRPAVVATEAPGRFDRPGRDRGEGQPNVTRGEHGRNRTWQGDARQGTPRYERYPGSREERPSSRGTRRSGPPESMGAGPSESEGPRYEQPGPRRHYRGPESYTPRGERPAGPYGRGREPGNAPQRMERPPQGGQRGQQQPPQQREQRSNGRERRGNGNGHD